MFCFPHPMSETALRSKGTTSRYTSANRRMESEIPRRHTLPSSSTQRFANALDLARGLTGDFRQLEEQTLKKLRDLWRKVMLNRERTRVASWGNCSSTHAAIKDSTQGQSSLCIFLESSLVPTAATAVARVNPAGLSHRGIDSALRSNRLIDRLSSLLLVEGERVVRSNERMAATLRRALESAASGEDLRFANSYMRFRRPQESLGQIPHPKTNSSVYLAPRHFQR